MRMTLLRPLFALFAILAAALACAGTLTVTSPDDDGYLGRSNTVAFNVSGADVQVRVTVVATAVATNTSTTISTTVTPDADGFATGSIDLDFNEGATEGAYTLAVSAVETGNAYTPTTLNVRLDVTAPLFTELSPVTGGFTRGAIKVRAAVEEENLERWTVRVGSQVIATGETTVISADYDATGLANDGAQAISITVTDLAGNAATKSLSLTLDRRKPTVAIVYPSASTRIGRDLNVIVDVTDASSSSVDRTGIDVIAKRTDGTYIVRVTLVSLRATSGTTQRWTGRVRYRKGQFPSRFTISASVIDRAGNASTLQEVTVRKSN